MALPNSKTITLILALFVILVMTNEAHSQPVVTSFTYDFQGSKPTTLTYQGDAHFPSDSTYLRLTKTDDSGNPLPDSAGRVMYSDPVQFWESGAQVDFETTVTFIIRSVDSNPGDGLVFFIAPVGSTIPPGHSGGNFGVFNSSSLKNPGIFAVEFDTYINSVDPDYRHVGIDIEYMTSVNTTDVGNSILGQVVTVRINYEEATKVISVHVTAAGKIYEVSYVFDLSSVLDEEVQVGLAASTGGAVAIHDVVSWYFTATLVRESGIRQYV